MNKLRFSSFITAVVVNNGLRSPFCDWWILWNELALTKTSKKQQHLLFCQGMQPYYWEMRLIYGGKKAKTGGSSLECWQKTFLWWWMLQDCVILTELLWLLSSKPNHVKVVSSAENRPNNPGNTCFSCTVYALCEAEFLRLFCFLYAHWEVQTDVALLLWISESWHEKVYSVTTLVTLYNTVTAL